MDYSDFLAKKRQVDPVTGILNPTNLNKNLFDFQQHVVTIALKRGREALFAGTGMGKTVMELSYAEKVLEHTNKDVLIITPLSVAHQFIDEGEKFGIEVKRAHSESDISGGKSIYVTNYQKLHHFDLSRFSGVVLDESGILKNETGKYRTALIDSTKDIPFRLPATATPAPNDFMELGNHAQFLGIMSYTDMLSTFFTHDAGDTAKWILKGHGEPMFWRWMATWSLMFQNPSDLGFDGSKYILPPLHYHNHSVKVDYAPNIDTGFLFPMEAQSMDEKRSATKSTLQERCELAAEITTGIKRPVVVWCNLNDEGDLLEKLIPGAKQVKGSDSDEKKEEILHSFSSGELQYLISKTSICGWGMNWQHCSDTVYVGLNDSFEQIYQSIRRFWRFGQKREVNAHFISSPLEGKIIANIRRKQKQAEHMMDQMVEHMRDIQLQNIHGTFRNIAEYNANQKIILPQWI